MIKAALREGEQDRHDVLKQRPTAGGWTAKGRLSCSQDTPRRTPEMQVYQTLIQGIIGLKRTSLVLHSQPRCLLLLLISLVFFFRPSSTSSVQTLLSPPSDANLVQSSFRHEQPPECPTSTRNNTMRLSTRVAHLNVFSSARYLKSGVLCALNRDRSSPGRKS